MNQRIIIYIILSAILLYLYYRRQDITVFAAFIVVVATTLIFRDQGSDAEGFGVGGGGGGGGDKQCAKFGFTAPKIVKNDIKGSLEKVMKNVKTVASKYMKNLEEDMTLKDKYNEAVKTIGGFEIIQSETEKLNKNKENQEYVMNFGFGTMLGLCGPYIMQPSEKAQDATVKTLSTFNKKDDQGKVPIIMVIKGGQIVLDILNKIKKSDEMKEADKDAKELISVGICAVKHFILIWKNIQKATADGGGGDDAGDEEEKPKKKKSKKQDDGDDDEEKPKKKPKKKAKKEEEDDDGGDE